MILPESYSADQFQEVIRYKDPTRSPIAVASSTANILDLYFSNNLPDMDVAKNYLARETTALIWSAEKGFYTNFSKIRDIRLLDLEELRNLTEAAKRYVLKPDLEDIEAFNVTLVTFSCMPALAKSKYLPMGFSRRGMLASPFTRVEFLERIHELRREIINIVQGHTDPKIPLESQVSRWRAYLFYHVASEIPIHMEENPREVQERTRMTVEDLLKDVQINL